MDSAFFQLKSLYSEVMSGETFNLDIHDQKRSRPSIPVHHLK